MVLDRPGAGLDEVATLDGVTGVAVDLVDRAAVQEAWRRVDQVGSVRALVALAGGYRPGALDELDAETLAMLWDTNVTAMLWCAQQAAVRLADVGGGAIVTVGSKTAVVGQAPVAHAGTKAAVVRMTELLADELRPRGVRVSCVLPSVIDTPANRSWMPPEQAARAVSPADIAKVIAFLCSDDAAVVSGALVPVYGDS